MSRRAFQLAVLLWAFVATEKLTFAQTKSASSTKAAASKTTPVPEMTLGRLASDESVFFLASNGWKKPAAKSSNKTELLWAEQSVQDFVEQLSDEIKEMIKHKTAGDDDAATIATTISVFLSAVIEHPLAVSLNSFTATEVPDIKLAIVIDTESDAKEVRETFLKLVRMIPEGGPGSLIEETIEDAKFYRPELAGPYASLAPQFGMFKSYFIATMGQGTTAETIKKINGSAKSPVWLDTTLRELKVDRPSMAWYVDMAAIWKTVDPLIDDNRVRDALDASGLRALKRVASVSGLDAVASVDKMLIETTGEPKGLLALLPDKPLTENDLKGIPANPAHAMIVRFDLAEFVETILKIADQVDPMPRQQFEMISQQVEPLLGFSIKDDLLQAFGDVWSTYISGSEPGGGFVPGMVFTVTVNSEEKLTRIQEALVERAMGFLQQMGPQAPVTLNRFTARGAKGYRVQINNIPIPIAPAWVVTKDQFVLGLSPQLVSSHLAAASAPTSFANIEEVKAAIKRDPKTVMLSYRNPKPEIQGVFTLVNMFSPMLIGQLQQQGIKFNLPPLPPFSDIEPHLAPSVATFTRTSNGWRRESHGVVPSISTVSPATAAVMVALLLPAVQQAREAARRTQAKNCLKQIGLAMHNYHDTFNHFPERVVRDKKGKPGLSWRVKILPYLDEAPLYNQFHLDEPWDSEHNKALIERMPMTYASPNDPELAKEGKTRFVVLAGEGTLFDGDEGPSMRTITDGTSNTIMVVEARPDHAVTWTEPDDLDVDFNDLIAGLENARVGGFHALLADGSVRFVSNNIDKRTLKALFTKAGGEVIGDF